MSSRRADSRSGLTERDVSAARGVHLSRLVANGHLRSDGHTRPRGVPKALSRASPDDPALLRRSRTCMRGRRSRGRDVPCRVAPGAQLPSRPPRRALALAGATAVAATAATALAPCTSSRSTRPPSPHCNPASTPKPTGPSAARSTTPRPRGAPDGLTVSEPTAGISAHREIPAGRQPGDEPRHPRGHSATARNPTGYRALLRRSPRRLCRPASGLRRSRPDHRGARRSQRRTSRRRDQGRT